MGGRAADLTRLASSAADQLHLHADWPRQVHTGPNPCRQKSQTLSVSERRRCILEHNRS